MSVHVSPSLSSKHWFTIWCPGKKRSHITAEHLEQEIDCVVLDLYSVDTLILQFYLSLVNSVWSVALCVCICFSICFSLRCWCSRSALSSGSVCFISQKKNLKKDFWIEFRKPTNEPELVIWNKGPTRGYSSPVYIFSLCLSISLALFSWDSWAYVWSHTVQNLMFCHSFNIKLSNFHCSQWS